MSPATVIKPPIHAVRRPIRIGIDATCWQNNRGYGRHTRALLRALIQEDKQNDYTLFLDSPHLLEPLPQGCRSSVMRTSRPTTEAASSTGHRSLADMWRVGMAMSRGAFDVLFFPTIYSYVPTFCRARKLVMIHDVIAETYPQLTIPNPIGRFFWNLKVGLGRRQADALVTVSEYSRRHIAQRFKVPSNQLHVVGEASDPVFRRSERPLTPVLRGLGIAGGPHTVVYVGGFGPHKQVDLLVRAFARSAAQYADAKLVLVGENRKEAFHSHFDSIESLVQETGVGDRTVFTGYLPDEELVVLLNHAGVLVLPSLMEGFGLPAVEAAACGCPVIATRESPLPELLGEAGLFIRPCKEELERALEMVLESDTLRMRMREAGIQAAGKLTWMAAADQLRDVIHQVTDQ